MLVLSRRRNQVIEIAGGLIRLTVLEIRGARVILGVDAPPYLTVSRPDATGEPRCEQRRDEPAIPK